VNHPHADGVPHVRPAAVAVSPPRLQPAVMSPVIAAFADSSWRVDGAHLVSVGIGEDTLPRQEHRVATTNFVLPHLTSDCSSGRMPGSLAVVRADGDGSQATGSAAVPCGAGGRAVPGYMARLVWTGQLALPLATAAQLWQRD
jgi:hypothetical protein